MLKKVTTFNIDSEILDAAKENAKDAKKAYPPIGGCNF